MDRGFDLHPAAGGVRFSAAILDAFSRRVIGWALDRNLDDELTLTALRMALERRSPPPALVHPSDRGSQYANGDYIALLEANHIRISPRGQAQFTLFPTGSILFFVLALGSMAVLLKGLQKTEERKHGDSSALSVRHSILMNSRLV